jgi:hypothetical protein
MSKKNTLVVHLEFLINISAPYFIIYKKKSMGWQRGCWQGEDTEARSGWASSPAQAEGSDPVG